MIRQKPITIKTSTATLTVAEFGDVIVNSATPVTITLSSPYSSLWFRINNVGEGIVTIVYAATTLGVIKQYEHLLALANTSTGWFCVKASYLMSKAEIESVLTGLISSHTHAYGPTPLSGSSAPTSGTVGSVGQLYVETTTPTVYYCSDAADPIYTWVEFASSGGATDFTDLEDVPSAYTGQGGKLLSVKSAEDGVEFIAVPPAENGVPTGGNNNQILAKDGLVAYAVKWVDAPAAVNGIPAGGTVGQVLKKIDGTDYNAQWADESGGGGTTPSIWGGL